MIKSDNFKASTAAQDVFSFRASNVTGTRELPIEVRRSSTVGDVTSSIVDLMALPDDVAWALRADRGEFLAENATIADQLEPGSHVTVTPRTHLG